MCSLIFYQTNGPVAHLTLGPGIYFNAFIHVYSTRAGADNPPPLGINVESQFYIPSHKVTGPLFLDKDF